MVNKRLLFLMDKRTQLLTLELANVGVDPSAYDRALKQDVLMKELYRMLLHRPSNLVSPATDAPITEDRRNRQLEDRFFGRLFELGLRDADPIGPVLRDKKWLGAFAARIIQPQAADRVPA